MGRYNAPTFSAGWISTDGVTFVGSTSAGAATTASTVNVAAADADGDVIYLRGDGDTSGRTPNFLNKFDMIRFQSGAVGLVLEDPTPSAAQASANGGIAVTAASYDVKIEMISGAANPLKLTDIHADAIFASIGSAFPNGSNGSDVGENYVYPSTYKNYLTTSRKKISVTGKDITDIMWIENNGHRLWYFTKRTNDDGRIYVSARITALVW